MHRRDYPSVKLGRFAVNAKFQNSSVGTHIVDFIKNMFITNNRTGCAFITVDALQSAVPFYLKNDFIFLEDVSNTLDNHTIQMYFNLKNYRM